MFTFDLKFVENLLISFIVGSEKFRRSKHHLKTMQVSSYKKLDKERKLSVIETSRRSDQKSCQSFKHQHVEKTLKLDKTSKHSNSPETSGDNDRSHAHVSSYGLQKQSNEVILTQNEKYRSSAPSSLSSLKRVNFKSKSKERKTLKCNSIPKIESKEDKWNDFDEMIRRIKSNLSAENYILHDSINGDNIQSKTTVESISKINEELFTQINHMNDSQSNKTEEGSHTFNDHIPDTKLTASNNVSEYDSDKDFHLRMSEDDIEVEQFKQTQQQLKALNGIVFQPPGKILALL